MQMKLTTIILTITILVSCSSTRSHRSAEINNGFITIESIEENPNRYKASCIGKIYHSKTKEMLVGINVELAKSLETKMMQTDQSGKFSFYDVSLGRYIINASSLGYFEMLDTLEFEIGKKYNLRIELSPKIEESIFGN